MKSKYKGEYVLTFPTKVLKQLGIFQGLCFNTTKYLEAIFKEQSYMTRDNAEQDPNYKQLIPYVLLHYKGTFLSYRRGALLAEDRLQNKYSIGIGGHISIKDPGLFGTKYEEGLKREITEEIYIDTTYTLSEVAVLNDDSDDVGKVHFAIIHILNLKEPLVRKKELSINELTFKDYNYLQNKIDLYENWSKICIANINKLIANINI